MRPCRTQSNCAGVCSRNTETQQLSRSSQGQSAAFPDSPLPKFGIAIHPRIPRLKTLMAKIDKLDQIGLGLDPLGIGYGDKSSQGPQPLLCIVYNTVGEPD